MTILQERFQAELPSVVAHFDYDIAPQTYFKIGGNVEIYVAVRDIETAQQVIRWCDAQECRLTILGGASNVIVADEGVSGVVLHSTADQVQQSTDDPAIITVEAGCKTALLVSKTIALGRTGLEYFLGVPGTLGGAIYNNAHYLQHLIGEFVSRVQVIDRSGEVTWLDKAECDFGYDHSRFQSSGEVIWAVEFTLPAGDAEDSRQLIKEATEYRASTQPLGQPSSGCIFQNTPNTPELQQRFPQFADRSHVPGGFLIDQAGLKGEKIGGVEVSHKHAAFMVNTGGATAADVKALIARVKQRVLEEFGVHLQEEVFYLGNH